MPFACSTMRRPSDNKAVSSAIYATPAVTVAELQRVLIIATGSVVPTFVACCISITDATGHVVLTAQIWVNQYTMCFIRFQK